MFDVIGKGLAAMPESPSKKPDLDLDELERLAKAATPGPWEHVGFGTVRGGCYIADCFGLSSRDERKIRQGMKNADYIVAACNSVPDLIAENRALRERVRQANELEDRVKELEAENADLKNQLREALERC